VRRPETEVVCADAYAALRSVPTGRVALTVTSPPYFRHRDYGVEGQLGCEATVGEYVAALERVLAELIRVTDQRGSCFLVLGDTYKNGKLLLVPHRVALMADSVGWTIRNDIIWSKTDPAPESPKTRWRSSHEHILFLTKKASGYRFNPDPIRVPYADATRKRWGAGQTYGGPKSRHRRAKGDSPMRHGQHFRLHPLGCIPTDVWRTPSSNTSVGHYATFSEQLVTPMVEACSDPGNLVLDPFAGAGTVGVVCKRLHRRFLGIELNPEYAIIARKAIEGVTCPILD
jgi:site-specific DNA-methyltransferase (adenine-specific)